MIGSIEDPQCLRVACVQPLFITHCLQESVRMDDFCVRIRSSCAMCPLIQNKGLAKRLRGIKFKCDCYDGGGSRGVGEVAHARHVQHSSAVDRNEM